MPVLKPVTLTTVFLPESEVTCKIGITYGDKIKINEILMREVSFKPGGESDKELSGSVLIEQAKVMNEIGLKEWDLTNEEGVTLPCTNENIELLPPKDGELLNTEIAKLAQNQETKKEEIERKKK